ncbi:MAG: FIST C-terminal domain-containing protein [Methylotenera sp.]|nr:FIST C-terminal domain-containing protein [Methylotenera sp.]
MKIATSIVIGRQASPALAAQAVSQAMLKADITIANSVLLMLSSEFASDPQPAIRAAAKAANCTQVIGCSATGIFTEEDWVLDAPAAAVMVFGGNISIQLASANPAQALLTLTAPNAINNTWLNDGNTRYGGISGDVIGQGPFSVWQNAKGDSSGRVEAFFTGVKLASKASHGLKILTKPKKINAADGYDIELLDHKTPYAALQKAWKMHYKSKAHSKNEASSPNPVPSHLIMAIYANSAEAINHGEFKQTTLIGHDEHSGHITLAQPLQAGQFLSWGLRDQASAEADLLATTQQLSQELGAKADFGLLFSCLGRGPFYDGIDHDLKVITQQLPNMPLLGFYGNGEIASVGGVNQLLPYSAVLSLFSAFSP